jgi:hemolysin D
MSRLALQWDVVRRAYALERTRMKALVRTRETSFLPSALEIVERPVSPTARLTARLLMGALAIGAVWITLGHVDVVASAQGQIVPGGYVKLVQPATAGIVRAIHVHDDQDVKAGQLLMELDPTVAGAEVAQADAAVKAAELDQARDQAILDAVGGQPLRLALPAGTSPDVAAGQFALARQTVDQIRATNAARNADRRSAAAAYAEASEQLAKAATLPLLQDEVNRYAELNKQGYVSQIRMLEIDRQRVGAMKDRLIAQATQHRAAAAVQAAGHAAAQSLAEDQARILADLVRAQSEVALRRQELAKMQDKMKRQRLVSPTDGVVAQLAVHTIGGVVEGGKPVMTVVPRAGPLVAEVKLLNRDVARIHIGDPVSLKIAAYPFTRYGTIPGRVQSVSANAIADSKRGLVYVARISLDRQAGTHRLEPVRLVPGMEVVADIRTGSRTLLSYLLSPLRATAAEALRED